MSTAARHRLVRTLPLGFAVLLGVLGSTGTAQADTAAPLLSIRVDDGQTDARSGSTLRYTVTVTNLGGKQVRDLAVNQTIPAQTKLGRAGGGGAVGKGGVRWEVDVPAGRSVTMQTWVSVGNELPPELFRLATVACAGTSPKASPTVCASDSDQLPAGAVALEQQRRLETAPDRRRPGWLLPVGLTVGGVLVVSPLAALATMRVLGKRRGRGPGRRGLVPHEPG